MRAQPREQQPFGAVRRGPGEHILPEIAPLKLAFAQLSLRESPTKF
jgi:hypothetical protein